MEIEQEIDPHGGVHPSPCRRTRGTVERVVLPVSAKEPSIGTGRDQGHGEDPDDTSRE